MDLDIDQEIREHTPERISKYPFAEVIRFIVKVLEFYNNDKIFFEHIAREIVENGKLKREIQELLAEQYRYGQLIIKDNTATNIYGGLGGSLVQSLKETIYHHVCEIKALQEKLKISEEAYSKIKVACCEQSERLNTRYDVIWNRYQEEQKKYDKLYTEHSHCPSPSKIQEPLSVQASEILTDKDVQHKVAFRENRDVGTQYDIASIEERGIQCELLQVLNPVIEQPVQTPSVVLDPWDEYKSIFNLDRKFIRTGRADIIDVIVKLTTVNKDAGINRFELINAVTKDQMRDKNYKNRVSSLLSEILHAGIPQDNIIRGIRLK